MVGRTPVFFMNKRQGAIETSIYGAEFCAMRYAVEEVQAVRYMLRCLGVKIMYASLICGDNMGVIQNWTILDSCLRRSMWLLLITRLESLLLRGWSIQSRLEVNTISRTS